MIPILYEEPHFLLVNKPAGLLTQAIDGIDSLQATLIEQLKQRDNHSGTPFIGLPHRLDRGTSGIVLIAKNQRALRRFGTQFQHRTVQKFYVAWVKGDLPAGVNHWQDYIRKVDNEARAEIVEPDQHGGRVAEMKVRLMASGELGSVVLVQLLTGRMHQVRLQLASRGFPIIGDQLYGGQDQSNALLVDIEHLRDAPFALHALRIEFRHPQNARQMAGTAPFPEYFKQAGSSLWSACHVLFELSCESTAACWRLGELPLDESRPELDQPPN